VLEVAAVKNAGKESIAERAEADGHYVAAANATVEIRRAADHIRAHVPILMGIAIHCFHPSFESSNAYDQN
jgi:hypothetical protein